MLSLNPGFKYDPHQEIADQFISSRSGGGAGAWLDTGLGKGVIGIKKLVDWLNFPGMRRALITVPPGLLEDWRMKLRLFAGIEASLWDEDDSHSNPIQLISHTLFQEPKADSKSKRRNRVPELIRWCPQIVIADESHKFRKYKAAQTKGFLKLVRSCRPFKRLALTATPTTTVDPEELRPQFQFIDQALLQRYGLDDWKAWRSRLCRIEYLGFGDTVVEKVNGCKNPKLLADLTSQVVIQMDGSVLKKPEEFTKTFYRMGKRAKKYHDKMARAGSVLEANLEVVTSTPLDRAIRMAQIRSGFVADFEQKIHDLDSTLIDTVMEMVSNTPKPLLICYRFRPTGDRLEAALLKAGLRIGHIRGGVTPAAKSAIEQKFQAGGLDVVVGQWQAICLGFTFTRGNHAIIAEPTFSLEEWIQFLGRINRRGQTQTCFYHLLIEPSATDEDNYQALHDKEDFAEKIKRGAVQLYKPA